MNKQAIKQIRELASRLPKVYQQCASGGEVVERDGENLFYPNVYNVEINHERRLRKAYEKFGLDGIKSYLEMITKLQKQRHEDYLHQRSRSSEGTSDDSQSSDAAVEVQESSKSDSDIVGSTEESVGTEK